MRLKRPRAALFDWDNTLVDSFGGIHLAINETLEAFGLAPWTYDETCRRISKSMRESFPVLFGDRWREAGKAYRRSYGAHHLDHVRPRPGAEALLRALDAAGVYLGVVSNKHGEFLRREIAHLGWRRYFGGIVGATDAESDKPHRAPVDLALAGSGIEAGPEVWLIGDHPIDVECAAASGCVPILLEGVANGADHAQISDVHWRFRNCTEIRVLAQSL